jgi:hypothetical protein
MPTLVELKVEVDATTSDDSKTIMLQDESTFLGEPADDRASPDRAPNGGRSQENNIARKNNRIVVEGVQNVGKPQNDATAFDDSATFFSKNLLLSHADETGEGGDESTILTREIHDQSHHCGNIGDESTILTREIRNQSHQCGNIGDESTIMTREIHNQSYHCGNIGDESTILTREIHDQSHQCGNIGDESTIMSKQIHNRNAQRNTSDIPNEHNYRSNYQDHVRETIQNFQRCNPGQLRDYRSMSVEGKMREQQNVIDLLARLGICKGGERQPGEKEPPPQLSQVNNTMERSPPGKVYSSQRDSAVSPLHSPYFGRNAAQFEASVQLREAEPAAANHPTGSNKSGENAYETDKSNVLLSPNLSPVRKQYSPIHNTQDSPANMSHYLSESVELVRAENSISSSPNPFESPERRISNRQKRLASTSGKRGADQARWRLNEDAIPTVDDASSGSDSEIARYSHLDILSAPSPSSASGDIFAASQSPISPKLTYPSSEDEESPHRGSGRLDPSDGRIRVDDSIDTMDMDTSIVNRKRVHFDENGKRRHLREIPANVALKDGATFHLEKLNMKRTDRQRQRSDQATQQRRRRLVSFPDPLSTYQGRERDRLKTVFKWISHLDSDTGTDESMPSGTIFSLSQQQIIDVTLKLLMGEMVDAHHASEGESLLGQTVIVARSKEDLALWETSLREGTGCSVLNHANLPLSERKSASTAKKCTFFDVILTSFDAIKSPDIATPIDPSGHAITSKVGQENGWYSSRTASQACSGPQTCKQFSVLHRIKFRRVIFVDLLGRKSFLAKANTSRAIASVALHGDSR